MKTCIDYEKIDPRTRKMMANIAPNKAAKLKKESEMLAKSPEAGSGRLLFEPEHFGGVLNHYKRTRPEGDDWMIPLENV